VRRWILLAALAALIVTACTGGGSTPEAALQRQFRYLNSGQWQKLYQDLHPEQRAFVSFDTFARCYPQSVVGYSNISLGKIIRTFQEEYTIPGTDQTVQSTAVTADVSATRGGGRQTLPNTFHEVNVSGIWYWTLANAEGYRAQSCPRPDDGSGNRPEAALQRQFDSLASHQWPKLYQELHPDQRAFISLDVFVRCYPRTVEGSTNITLDKILRTVEAAYIIPGTEQPVRSTAVTAQVSASDRNGRQTVANTFHEISVNGVWYWTLANAEEYRGEGCPASLP